MDRLLARLGPSSNLNEWLAADRLSPPVGEQVVYMVAQLCALTYNTHRGKDAQPRTAQDFIPDWAATDEERKAKRQERLKKKMEMTKLERMLMGRG